MYKVYYSNKFRKDYKKIKKNKSFNENIFIDIVKSLQQGKPLDYKYHDHNLQGKYSDCRECHIAPDILLIYSIRNEKLILELARIGSHSKLFK